LWKILKYYGVSDQFINIFKGLYINSSCLSRPQVDTQSSLRSSQSGVRQGCILSPFLFIIIIDFVTCRTMDKPEYGIIWKKQNRLTDLYFADDIAILAEEESVCQEMTTKLEEQSAQVGLNVSRERTVMGITQRPSTQPIAVAQGNIECRKIHLPGKCNI